MTNLRTQASLLPHCIPCGSRCCRYSSPILDQEERDRIVSATGKDYFVEVKTVEGSYFVIGRKPNGEERDVMKEPCSFLATDGSCSIQDVKPLDCGAYPLRATPQADGRLAWLVHKACPAVGFLSTEFISAARELAERSVHRFPASVYFDWLRRFSSWTLQPDAVLPESAEVEISHLEWWQSFFDDKFVRFSKYESTFNEEEPDVGALARLSGVNQGSRVLELGCKWGVLSHSLAKFGITVDAVELSFALLKEWNSRKSEKEHISQALYGDYRALPLEDRMYDLIVGQEKCLGLWLNEQDDLRVLREAARVAKENAKLILNLPNIDHCIKENLVTKSVAVDDEIWTITNYFDSKSRRWVQHHTIRFADGVEEVRASVQRLYTWPELSSLLESTDFSTAQVYGDFDESVFSMQSRRMVIVATK